jgi:hypothetical protein
MPSHAFMPFAFLCHVYLHESSTKKKLSFSVTIFLELQPKMYGLVGSINLWRLKGLAFKI